MAQESKVFILREDELDVIVGDMLEHISKDSRLKRKIEVTFVHNRTDTRGLIVSVLEDVLLSMGRDSFRVDRGLGKVIGASLVNSYIHMFGVGRTKINLSKYLMNRHLVTAQTNDLDKRLQGLGWTTECNTEEHSRGCNPCMEISASGLSLHSADYSSLDDRVAAACIRQRDYKAAQKHSSQGTDDLFSLFTNLDTTENHMLNFKVTRPVMVGTSDITTASKERLAGIVRQIQAQLDNDKDLEKASTAYKQDAVELKATQKLVLSTLDERFANK